MKNNYFNNFVALLWLIEPQLCATDTSVLLRQFTSKCQCKCWTTDTTHSTWPGLYLSKFPGGGGGLGVFFLVFEGATAGYEHLVEGRSQCWSLNPRGSTGAEGGGGLKSTPLNLFINISRGGDFLARGRIPPPTLPANTALRLTGANSR